MAISYIENWVKIGRVVPDIYRISSICRLQIIWIPGFSWRPGFLYRPGFYLNVQFRSPFSVYIWYCFYAEAIREVITAYTMRKFIVSQCLSESSS